MLALSVYSVQATVVAVAAELPLSVLPQSNLTASVCVLVHGYGSASSVLPQESSIISHLLG